MCLRSIWCEQSWVVHGGPSWSSTVIVSSTDALIQEYATTPVTSAMDGTQYSLTDLCWHHPVFQLLEAQGAFTVETAKALAIRDALRTFVDWGIPISIVESDNFVCD
ncbi:hypothetical protein TorRG33x02_146190 [Trema orientale]|uniref:Uncharacterized protein n=1 Tax=Trema orientale TaxID=63057 RepID=A0A2P5EVS1_TREOI|nr:hypothetical protein TorRG33x02_146190 [Trema orientale]